MTSHINENVNQKKDTIRKTNDSLLIATTAIYSYLFYEQNAGINFLLFNLVVMAFLLIRNKSLLHKRKWLLAAVMCLVSSSAIFFNSSVLAILTNICGLLLLSAYSFDTATSAIFSFLFSCYSVASSVVYAIIDASARAEKDDEKENSQQKTYKFFTIFIVALLCLLFFVLYRNSNPLFESNTQWINFNFISFSWVVFTVFGFFILYGLFYHRTLIQVDSWEKGLALDNAPAATDRKSQHSSEISAGILLFAFLNLMLIVLNWGDINTIWLKGALPKGISHSDFVHNGVSLTILSIVIATVLIMFLYRNNFQSIKNSRILKLLVCAWIIQNLVMLFSTACRNQFYIHDYNLTYKRVGVYVWLFLAAIGLAVTYLKIRQEKSNWFLVRSNFAVWFCFLTLSCTLNWDVLITRYNLNNKPLSEIDFYYLFSLSEANIPDLLKVTKDKDFNRVNGYLRNYKETSQYNFNSKTFRSLMKTKIKDYLKEYKSDWQSQNLRDRNIMASLTRQ